MAEDADDKTEDPSGRKLDEARKSGQIGRSMDLSSASLLAAGVSALMIFGSRFISDLENLMRDLWGGIALVEQPTDQWFFHISYSVIVRLLAMLWPMLIILMVVGFVVNVAQVGLNFSAKPLEFKLSKIFSWKALIRPISKDAWVELFKGLSKMIIIGWVAYNTISGYAEDIVMSIDLELISVVHLIWKISIELLWKIIILLFVLGLVDLIYQKRKTHNQLKMTKQEVKEETKNTTGDPKMIAARKRVMMKMYQQFMMKEVPKATVVITNPTFIAIAIRYERGKDKVPVVVAKGKRLIADRIRTLATEHGIPIVENKPLARGMYDQIEVGGEVPQEYYSGVAEVLAYVFTMDQRKAAFA